MRILLARAAAFALVTAMTIAAAGATTATSTLSITATIASACTFSASTYPLDISALIGLPNSAQQQAPPVSITCAPGTYFSVTASPGNSGSCAAVNRRFLSTPVTGGGQQSASMISYQLQLGLIAAPIGEWCDHVVSSAVEFRTTGTGSPVSIPYFLSTPGYQQDPRNPTHAPYASGIYSDTITLTARF